MTASRVKWSRSSRIVFTRDGQVKIKSDDVKKLNWATRNPNYGEMTASGLITDAVTYASLYI